MKKIILFIFVLILLSSFTSARLFDTASVKTYSLNTDNEKLILNTSQGDIQTYLVRYAPLLDRWIRVKGTFYNDYTNHFNNREIKFGVIDSEILINRISNYRYYFVSDLNLYQDGEWVYFYSDFNNKSSFININLRDICSRQLNSTQFAECKYTLKKTENNKNILIVDFFSDKNIDPYFTGGNGTSINPYQISDWYGLNDTRNYLTSYFILMNDLDSSVAGYTGIGDSWMPIGTSSTNKFAGVFDGQNYTISGLYNINNLGYPKGLFGYGEGATIKNLNVIVSNFTNNHRVGGIAGQITGLIENVNVSGYLRSTASASIGATGGVVGYHGGGTSTSGVYNSNSNASIYTVGYGGGIIGQSGGSYGVAINCSNNGSLYTSGSSIGGIIGNSVSLINNSINYGIIKASTGACGGIAGTTSAIVENSLNYGRIEPSSNYVGGIIGDKTGSTIRIYNNTNYGLVQGNSYTGGIVGRMTGRVLDCANHGNIIGGQQYTGGIFGGQQSSANNWIINSSNYANISSSLGSTSYMGGVGGSIIAGQLNNSYNYGTVTGNGNNYIGGVLGYITGTTKVNKVANYNNVSCYSSCGGIFGDIANINSIIDQSFNYGNVSCGFDYCGGISGRMTNGNINNSYSMGDVVSKTSYSGGGVGRIDAGNISNIYSKGKLTCTTPTYCGGLIGFSGTGTKQVLNSYWDINTSGYSYSAFGTGYTTQQLKNISYLGNWSIATSTIDLNNGYPYLSWQGTEIGYIWRIYESSTPSYCYSWIGDLLIIPTSCGLFNWNTLSGNKYVTLT